MPTYDSNITKVAKGTGSYTVVTQPSASYTVVSKGSRPATTKTPKPYLEPLALLTESGIEILFENEFVMAREG